MLQRARTSLGGSYVRPRLVSSPNLLERYVRAWEEADVVSLVALLREDAVLTMPPKPAVVGAKAIGDFLAESIFPIAPMRLVAARANQSSAFVAIMQKRPFALLVIDGGGELIKRIHAFADPRVLARFEVGV
jgi:RNA polymerase sigma-70 factor (ECF subfamily)